MSWTTPTLTALIQRISNDFSTRLQDATAWVRTSLPWITSRVLAGAAYDLHGFIDYLTDQLFPSRATDSYLDDHGKTWGITRTAATNAAGFVLVTGGVGDTLPADSPLTSDDGLAYKTTEAVLFAVGTETIRVQADDAGEDGNLDGGANLTLSSPPAGFTAATTAITGGLTGGGAGTKATGYAIIYATAAGMQPSGSSLRRVDGLLYQTTQTTTWTETGWRAVPIQAAVNGATYNCDAGTALTILVPGVGVTAACTVAEDGIVGGTDEETDASYRARILSRIRTPPHGGALGDYVVWAEATEGVDVVNVWPFAYPTLAKGQVDVYFTVYDSTNGVRVPTTPEKDLVQAELELQKPAGTTVTAKIPTVENVTMTITLHVLPDYVVTDVRSDIQAELRALFAEHALSTSTTYVRNSDLHAAINRASGIDYYTLDVVEGGVGTSDVILTAYEFPVLSPITWS
jgi:uncharacterized phage protein gp47/JayE